MMRRTGWRVAMAAATLAAAAPVMAQVATPPSPADLYGPLFAAVQAARVFGDGKTFADATPLVPVTRVMADWARERPRGPDALRAFVLARFAVPGVNDRRATGLRAHVRSLWPTLTRAPVAAVAGGSALAIPAPFVVPGGRFREMYYWDSYFTMLGLSADGQQATVEAMIADFTDAIERWGHVPNGWRSYYLSRSQPPFYALMLDLTRDTDSRLAARRLAALKREHDWWMDGADCLAAGGACRHVVRMPDGALLNRYWDARDTPRDESWAEDSATIARAGPRPAGEVARDLRSAAESGWDFSSRWLSDPARLETARTTRIVPVDLNSLMLMMEERIAARCRAAGDPCAGDYAAMAARRRAAIGRWLWVGREGRFADWELDARRATPVLSAAAMFPLFAGAATPAQGAAMARTAEARLFAPGGLRTTGARTGQQWDAPNGWAPLQWVAVAGLARYGETARAHEVARRWLTTVARTYADTGRMLEKYDVEESRPGGGGEYPTQDGFGWTNGVASAMLDRYPDLASATDRVATGRGGAATP
jgi:alpha,alpha-trehalase